MTSEDPHTKLTRIENDVDSILELYEAAEKAYPYSNLHGQRVLNEN